MKIYTGKGDQGETELFGGSKVPKDSRRIEAYGTLDELNSLLGVARSTNEDTEIDSILAQLQAKLFELGAELAAPESHRQSKAESKIPQVSAEAVAQVEAQIDSLQTQLKPLRQFILPGGSLCAAILHLARSVCRRAERRLITLQKRERVNPEMLRYLNRLSDLLFVMARLVNSRLSLPENTWKI